MSKKLKGLFKKRAFLNPDMEMSAFVVAIMEEFRYNRHECGVAAYPTLDIGDCYRKVSLDFGFCNKQEMRKAHKKLETLRSTINGFADAFDAEVKRFEEHEKTFPKNVRKTHKRQTFEKQIELKEI